MTADIKNRTIGRRKRASARVRLERGTGKITVNGMEFAQYFTYAELQDIVLQPLKLLGKEKAYDLSTKVAGGGKKGQATAICLGVARALVKEDETVKKTLKSVGLLTRDPRIKERKKFGLKKARRAPQWSKR
ncbi:MAG: 30S ribosomal protein S9 [Candidatus Magasanikbacteria bacterium RIFOXYC2_FULL_42_28]|uniref:Small ribosomal subunit protein uS9 n=1 Tax=Candidatus Magasanikbacteria bacterium RIFOXYC2_FULL_42_28 TaxID=1798704 RepID=A0A1F6NXI5_9BACT|nr:MAG: 30S ribosomal protein S9 [Candidatus Magasanikbacteria bacterium RIFOXYC2_FULL_42_28]